MTSFPYGSYRRRLRMVAEAPADPADLVASVTGALRREAPEQRDDVALLVVAPQAAQ